jgi:quinol monooxygenase YgiN
MKPFTILVEFTVGDGLMPAFLPHMLANARASVEREPGCVRFDVLRPEGRPDTVLLYEVYRDRAAFDAHGASPHYVAFAQATAGMVSGKSVTVCETVDETDRKPAPAP